MQLDRCEVLRLVDDAVTERALARVLVEVRGGQAAVFVERALVRALELLLDGLEDLPELRLLALAERAPATCARDPEVVCAVAHVVGVDDRVPLRQDERGVKACVCVFDERLLDHALHVCFGRQLHRPVLSSVPVREPTVEVGDVQVWVLIIEFVSDQQLEPLDEVARELIGVGREEDRRVLVDLFEQPLDPVQRDDRLAGPRGAVDARGP